MIEIYIKTGFPFDLDYKLCFNSNKLEFITNDIKRNDNKITVSEAKYFMDKFIKVNKNLITDLFIKYPNINKKIYKKKKISFMKHFVCLEDFRNISYGFINSLIKDNSPYSNNKIGDFGFLAGNSKPIRLKFIKLSKTHKMLEYLSTPIYNKNNPKMITFNDMKKYKYLIDLPGHSYSTKIYSYLFNSKELYLE